MTKNLTVGVLKEIIKDIPDDMAIVIPVIDEDDADILRGFRLARTAGILKCVYEKNNTVLCLNTVLNCNDISDQIKNAKAFNDIKVSKILFSQKED